MSATSKNCPSKRSLSQTQQQLIELLQRLNFGRIENLEIRNGEPVLSPAPKTVREHKFGGDNSPRPESGADNFLLKAQVIELISLIKDLQDGSISLLEVKYGLPFRALVSQDSA